MLPEFRNNRFAMESSEKGLIRFIKDFFLFDIDLDIKCSKLNPKIDKMLDEAILKTEQNHFIDLGFNSVLHLNCGLI